MIVGFLKWSFFCLFVSAVFTACEDDDPAPDPVIPSGENGVFILNQGGDGRSNAGLSFLDYNTDETTFDLMKGGLGDLGQDMMVYGKKLYIAMSGSANITVLNVQTKALIQRIALEDDNHEPRKPRHLTSYGGKVYASTYDGNVIRLDTTALRVEESTPVGASPEGIAAVNGKLYVAISDAYNKAGFGKTLDVVDIAAFKKEKSITVGINPELVMADSYGDIYLTYRGNYDDVPAGFQRVETKTGKVTDIQEAPAANFTILGDLCYFYSVTYDKEDNWTAKFTFGVYNIKTESLTSDPVITDGTTIKTPYAIGVNPDTKEVYIGDTDYSNPGTVHVFGTDGKKKKTLDVGLNPCQFIFY